MTVPETPTTPASLARKPLDDEIDVHGLTHPGKVNQDHLLLAVLRKRMEVYLTSLPEVNQLKLEDDRLAFVAMIADGVGGGTKGEVASRVALQVGDSRHYVHREGELLRITRDQTMAQELFDQGVLTRTDAFSSRLANVLSSAIGGSQTAPVVTRLQSDWRNVHLLCTDGLTKHVSDERITQRLATMTSTKQVCEALLQDALDDGGSDNVTIVVGRAVRKDDGGR